MPQPVPEVSPTPPAPSPGRPRPAILALGAAALVFLALACAVRAGATATIDRAILLALRVAGQPALPRGPGWLPRMMTDLSSLGSPTVLWLIVLASSGILVADRKRRLAAFLVATMASGVLLVSVAKLWFDRARPEVVPHLVPVETLSFPSGHASESTIVYLTLAMLASRLPLRRPARTGIAGLAVALVFVIGLSRLYLGVHWPSDVVVGWAFGVFWAVLAHAVGRAARWL